MVLNWTNPLDPDFDHIEIWYSTNDMPLLQFQGTIDPAGTVLSGLDNDKNYSFIVKSVDIYGNVSEGTIIAGTPADLPPEKVSELTATAGHGFVTLSWPSPSDDDFDHVEIEYSPDGSTPVLVDPGLSSVTISGLDIGTIYSFTVKTVDSAGNTSEGMVIQSTPVDTQGPMEIADLESSTGDGEVTLTWTNPADDDFDHVEITYTPGGSSPCKIYDPFSSVVIGGLENGSTYTFTAKTVDTLGNKSAGVSISVSLPLVIVASPDTSSVYQGKYVTIPVVNLLSNDTNNLNDEPLEIVQVKDAVNGTVTVSGANVTFSSTGPAGVEASFVYVAQIQGYGGAQAEGTVTLTVAEAPSVIANADTYTVQQGSEKYILVSDLLANDEGTSLSFVSYENPVGGTIAKSGDTITFTSTGIAYEPAEFEYTVKDSLNTTATGKVFLNVTPLSAIEAYIYHDSSLLNAKLAGYIPPSVSDIFNNWGRFDGNYFYENKDASSGNADDWEFLTDPDRVSMPLNVTPYNGFVSPEKLENYTFEATLSSPNSDNDTVGLVIAFVREGSKNYVLSALRTHGGTDPSDGWGVVYGDGETGADYNNRSEWIIDQKSVGGVEGGWSGDQSRVKIQREGDIIRCYTTDWNSVDSYEATSEIVIDLSSDSRLARFKGAQSYGYSTFSQPYSTYLDINLGGALDVTRVFDANNGEVWEYIQGSGWTKLGTTVQQELGYVREVTNPETGDTYLIKEDEIIQQ